LAGLSVNLSIKSQYASNIVSSAGGEDAQVPASEAAPSPSQGRPIGVIIETSVTPNLIPLMLHFLSVLGPSWTIVLFTLESTWHLPSSPALRRAIQHKQIEIRFLPADTVLNSSGAVSTFLTGPWLWEQLLSAPRVLFFQTDSVICSNSDITVESFFDYDFLGAPIASQYGQGYNGGLSLRNPKMFLEITQMSDFKTSGESFEDQWFYKEVKKRGGALPVEDVAKTFSVETIYYEKPLGYHQPQRWQKDHMEQIEEWCPEVKMLIGRRAQ
jgi:hypothetical protein